METRISRHSCRSFLLVLVCSTLLYCSVAIAQTTPDLEQGLKPYGSYDGGNIDSVNLSNGNVYLHVPLLSYPQRGGKLPLSFFIGYNNKGYIAVPNDPTRPNGPKHWQLTGTGVYVAREGGISFRTQKIKGIDQSGDTFTLFLCTALTSDGATHQMTMTGLTGCQDTAARTLDTSGILGGMNGGTVVATHRTGVSPTADTNGNYITVSSSEWTDTLGRVIPGSADPTYNYPYGLYPGVTTTDFSGCQGAVVSARIWNVPAPGGGTESYKLCYQNFSYQTAFGVYLVNEISGTATLLSQIVLPNGTYWLFSYNSYLDLTDVYLPTKGSISYNWINPIPGTITGRAVASRTVNDGTTGHTSTYSYNPVCTSWYGSCQTTVTDALNNDSVHTFTNGYETKTQSYQGTGSSRTLLKTLDTTYSFTENPFDEYTGATTWINVVPLTRKTTWPDGEVSQTSYTYDSGASFSFYDAVLDTYTTYPIVFGDVVQQVDYDYGNGAPGPVLRTTNTTYAWQSPNPNYASYLSNNLLDLVSSVQVLDGSGTQRAYTTYGYDESGLQPSGVTEQKVAGESYPGNQTSVHRWLNTGTFTCPGGGSGGSNGFVVSSPIYYDTGTVYSASDPCGHSTSYQYSSTYFGGYPTKVTNALGQSTTYGYDFDAGEITSATDPNQLTSTYSYDSMWRLAQANHPDGGQGTITRQEVSLPFTATLTSTINAGQNKTSVNAFDGLGRVTRGQLTSDPQGTVYTDTTYDGVGHVATVSNPYRSGTDATSSPGITTYGYDGLGRKTTETYPDGSTLTTAYCGSSTLVTDPAGKWRRSRVNGLGQLVEVDEPNAVGVTVNSNGCPGTGEHTWVTSYTNDVLGNLKQVVQNGSHTRTFTYDSLSRLLTSGNPETGAITYTYNPDGTVLTKKDARNITTSYTYDALHRETGVSYSNGDPSLTFTYDGTNCLSLAATCHNIGHRTGMTDGAGSESWAYLIDKPNSRSIHRERRTTNSSPNNITKTTTYYLDLAGNVTQIVYPAGRTVNYTHDSADRPSSATDASNGITYVADSKTPPNNTNCTAGAVCYTPQGSVYSMSIGQTSFSFTGFNIFENFNSRLQPQEIKASSTAGNAIDITYNFVDSVSGHNAGHVYGITNNLNSSRSQAFTYDQVNRILSAGTTATTGTYCWGYNYSYDAWGNLLSQAGWTPTYNGCTETTMGTVTDPTGNNHISAMSYDASGNALGDGLYTYAWDGESQMKTAVVSGVTYTYSYDGDGRRAAKVGSKLYWYGSGGEILSETDAAGNTLNEYVYFGGKRVALVPATGSVLYYAEDMLGSSRVMVNSTGTVCYDADFTPFGGERAYTSTCAQNYKFEGKERDTETQNDDFGAREYSWRFGRWLSSDWSAVPVAVPYANLTNPQTLNLYAMVTDDPESFADLDGHGCVADSTGKVKCTMMNDGGNQPPNANGTLAQNTTARATEAGEAALNFTLGKIKFDAALGMAATAETGVGAAAAAYTAISATGNFVSGTVQTIGAATGQTKLTEAGAEVVATTTSALGMGTFLATGNLNKAATAAAVEGIVTSSPKDLATGGTVARAAKAIDLMQNISSVWNSVKSYVVNPGPPTIPTPGLPPQ